MRPPYRRLAVPQHVRPRRSVPETPGFCKYPNDIPTRHTSCIQDSTPSSAVCHSPARDGSDGKYLLTTSDPTLSAGEIAPGYKNLLEAERSFRDMKSTLSLRPVYHRLETRIRAHVLLCWLALLLVRVAERRTKTTWTTINRQMSRVHAVTLTGTAGTVVHTTPLSTTQAGIVTACGLPLPPAVTAIDPT